ncbi:hypothetical protein FNF28_07253 [Cafeteria roenbergensis]|uniref:Uncharacterized protein n=1 Tax=Cafeteria roenbergensis TaxID=33653 RepID=A0A5A8CC91_CAFRO|nr:hypothetical protein FNF28_07253 [Cafeteria roenbergensis]
MAAAADVAKSRNGALDDDMLDLILGAWPVGPSLLGDIPGIADKHDPTSGPGMQGTLRGTEATLVWRRGTDPALLAGLPTPATSTVRAKEAEAGPGLFALLDATDKSLGDLDAASGPCWDEVPTETVEFPIDDEDQTASAAHSGASHGREDAAPSVRGLRRTATVAGAGGVFAGPALQPAAPAAKSE